MRPIVVEFLKYFVGFFVGSLFLFIDFKWQWLVFLWFAIPVVAFLTLKIYDSWKEKQAKR